MALTDLIPFRNKSRREEPVPVQRDDDSPFLRLQEDMNRLFEDLLPAPWRNRGGPAPFAGGAGGFMPGIDIRETRKDIRVTAELPGVDEKDLDVRLDGDVLTLRGEKREEKTEKDGVWARSECTYGSFVRSIPLGARIQADRVSATFRKGVLTVKLPKAKPHAESNGRIKVEAG